MADLNSLQITFLRLFDLLKLLWMLLAHSRKAISIDVTALWDLQRRFLIMVEDSVDSTNARAVKWLLKGLKGHDAQSMVDFLSEVLSDKEKLTLEKQKTILYFLTILAKSAQVFPQSLKLTNVECNLAGPPPRTGGNASIYQGSYGGQAVCVKVCYSGDKLERRARAQAKELIIWAQLEHPNVLPLYGFYFSNERVCIVTPWMERDNLSMVLRVNSGIHPILWLHDIISGLTYLHSRDIIHGDLKAANVLISETERAMLADFGISRVLTELTVAETANGLRTAHWAAPELFRDYPPTQETDVWAFGCTIYEILTGDTPFYQYKSTHSLMYDLLEAKAECLKPRRQWSELHEAAWELGKQCRTFEHNLRPKSNNLLHSITQLKSAVDDNRLPSVEISKPRKIFEHINCDRISPILRQIDCFNSLKEILARPISRQWLMGLVDDDAQSVVDFLSELLDKDAPLLSHERRSVLHLLCKLAKSAQVFPQSLEVQDIDSDLDKPVSGGGLNHIYEGQYEDRQIHIKVIRLDRRSDNLEQRFKAQAVEAICWAHLSHQNIPPFDGIYLSDADVHGICIVSSLVVERNMLHYLIDFPDSPSKYIPLLHDIISGLQYLHNLGIIYVNLRAKNVLVSGAERARLAGFEISRITAAMIARGPELTVENANWMAPELLIRDNRSPTKESDIWAFGCTCYEAMTSTTPFYHIPNLAEAFQQGNIVPSKPDSASEWDGLRKKVWSTVAERCWKYDPKSRPTSDAILGIIKELIEPDERNDDPEPLKVRRVDPGINFSHLYDVLQGASNAEDMRAEEERQVRWALMELASRGMPGAMLDSKDRTYAPRCSEGTLRSLRSDIVNWGQNSGETRHLLWLLGPAGVGKSAVAQTVAEEFKERSLLGAVFFFSRPNNRADPDVVIPTLVYQLALLLPQYRRVITQRLVDNPLILHRSRRSQFNELLADPFRSLMAQYKEIAQRPLLIVLDGLDECNDRHAQMEFVEMISHHALAEPNTPLRWMICSRPEPHLRVAFRGEENRAMYLKVQINIDDSETRADAIHILRRGFAEIRTRYPDQLAVDWPGEDDIHYIAERSAGHLGIVSSIIRFIGDADYDDPRGQLNVCLRFLGGKSGFHDLNPIHALDLLYTQVLSDIPAKILPISLRILGLLILYGGDQLTALGAANFLGLNQASFYRALQRLHSILLVPSIPEASAKPVRIYHASFSDYLREPARSGKYCLNVEAVHSDVAIWCLKWLRHCNKKVSKYQALPELAWLPLTSGARTILASVCKFSFTSCWKACPQVPERNLRELLGDLERFDFDLNYSEWPNETLEFTCFVRWLLSSSLVVIDRRHAGEGDSAARGEISIWQRDDDPYAFVAPLYEGAERADTYSFHLRLGESNSAAFWLKIAPDISPRFIVDTP